MALYTKKKFAELVGVKTSTLSNHISRPPVKVIVGKDDMIDSDHPINADYIKTQQAKSAEQGGSTVKILPIPTSKPAPKPYTETPIDADPTPGGGGYALVNQKTKAQISKLTEEINILKLRQEKIQGESLPTALIKPLLITHTDSIFTANKIAIDRMIVSLTTMCSLDNEQKGKLRQDLIDALNVAKSNALAASKKDLKRLISEYSETKSVGEHE